MPKHSILQNQQTNQHLSRNAFDLSYRHLFTADVGEILPVYVEHVNPNEHFKINPNIFLRAQTLNTAAFTRMKQNIDFFFVPYRLLGTLIPQILVGTNYITSSAVEESSDTKIDNIHMPYLRGGNNIAQLSTYTPDAYPVDMFDADYRHDKGQEKGVSNPYYSSGDDWTTYSATSRNDMFGFSKAEKASRLMELLGYGKFMDSSGTLGSTVNDNYALSPLNIFAYQKIYYDFYRNPILESYNNKITNLDGYMYPALSEDSFTSYYVNGDGYFKTGEMAKAGLFDVHYINYKRDYYTHMFKNFRGVDFLTNFQSSPEFPVIYSYDNNDQPNPIYTEGSAYQGFIQTSGVGQRDSFLSISNLRSAYALDKLLAITQNAKDGSYNEQIAAHFGFSPRLDSQKVRFIGSCDAPVTISDVEGTASTDKSSLAQIAGKGVSLSNGTFEFDTNEHGIIMGLFYLRPECDYWSSSVNPFNLKLNKEDFFTPEYQDLGLQPVTYAEVTGPNGDSGENPNSYIFGYNNRYAEYKSRVDRISGEFMDDLNAWVTPRSFAYAQLSNSDNPGLSLGFVKVNPSSMNNIFAIKADGVHNQFMCAAQFNVTAIRPMSVFGSPYSNI